MMVTLDHYLSVAEAADALGVSPATVRRWIAAGLLGECAKCRGRWCITPAAVRRLL